MNKYQNAGESCAFFQCETCRGYTCVEITRDIRSSRLHMYTKQLLLKILLSLQKFTCTGVSFQPTTFSFIEKETPVYILRFLRNFLGILLLWKASCKLVLKEEIYEKWKTNIFYYNKEISQSQQLFPKNRHCEGKCIFENHLYKVGIELNSNFQLHHRYLFLKYVSEIFCISYYFQEKNDKGVK